MESRGEESARREYRRKQYVVENEREGRSEEEGGDRNSGLERTDRINREMVGEIDIDYVRTYVLPSSY